MATRFYLPSTGAAAVSPAYGSGWDDTADANPRLAMVRTRISSAFAIINATETGSSTTNARDVLIIQYVSEPIPQAQTISGTLRGQMRMLENNTLANALPQMIARVVSNDGVTERGTLWAGDTRTTNVDELPQTHTNSKNPAAGISPVTLSALSVQADDRIVVEIGQRLNNTVATNYQPSMRIGDSAGSDLTVGGTETTDLNPWVEFSADIDFTAIPMQTLTTTQQRYTYY